MELLFFDMIFFLFVLGSHLPKLLGDFAALWGAGGGGEGLQNPIKWYNEKKEKEKEKEEKKKEQNI